MTFYRNQMHRKVKPVAEICGHALRYAYAGERLQAHQAAGVSKREAQALTSIDLGHGDGRGTYVAQVYARQPELRQVPRRWRFARRSVGRARRGDPTSSMPQLRKKHPPFAMPLRMPHAPA